MKWPFTKRTRPAGNDRLRDLEGMFEYFQDLETEFRGEREDARREEDQARSLDDDVNREMFRRRIDLLDTFLQSIAKIKFVIDQVRYTIRFQEGMGRYGELRQTLADAEVSAELKRALEGIHQDLELIRRSSNVSMEKIDGYFETLKAGNLSPDPSLLRLDQVTQPEPPRARSERAEKNSPSDADSAQDVEARLRRRLEEN
jgi:hypothetical protein